jgi:hypothetical protein
MLAPILAKTVLQQRDATARRGARQGTRTSSEGTPPTAKMGGCAESSREKKLGLNAKQAASEGPSEQQPTQPAVRDPCKGHEHQHEHGRAANASPNN